MPVSIQTPDPLVREFREAIDASGVRREARDFQTALTHAQARSVAAKVGRGMLAAATRETAEHSDDVVVVTRAICEVLGVTGGARQDVLAAARLHDIGKAAIPKEILEKPGRLNDEEWELMRSHTVVGADILAAVPELKAIAAMVRYSHERWDGAGYPEGLAGEEIPLGSRIIFAADAFHAIRSDRPYRAGRPAAEALAEVRAHAGTQFDPRVVEALDAVAAELRLTAAPAAGRRVRRSSRLTALLMVLCIGGGGSAVAAMIAATGGEGSGTTAPASSPDAAPADPSSNRDGRASGADGARPKAAPDRPGSGRAERPSGATSTPGAGSPADSGADGPSAGADSNAGGDETSNGEATADDGGGADSGHPHGGPPGQTGNHPLGGPPGQTGDHPQGDPPGQTGDHPLGGPPGQAKPKG